VHADPELEADVFSELDEDLATRLLGARTDEEIAAVLARMRADDAADAIAELPQRRRLAVLDLLPPGQRTKVLTLMGFNSASAGGLMGMDFIALPTMATVGDHHPGGRRRPPPARRDHRRRRARSHAARRLAPPRGRRTAGHPARGRPLTASGTFTHESIGDGLFG